MMLFSFFLLINKNNVYALDKIEGGDVTIDSLGTIIKSLATKIQVFGIVLFVYFSCSICYSIYYW